MHFAFKFGTLYGLFKFHNTNVCTYIQFTKLILENFGILELGNWEIEEAGCT